MNLFENSKAFVINGKDSFNFFIQIKGDLFGLSKTLSHPDNVVYLPLTNTKTFNTNIRGTLQETLLHVAAFHDQKTVTEWLLSHAADPNLVDKGGMFLFATNNYFYFHRFYIYIYIYIVGTFV
jgi:hypothetical protein